MAVESKLDKMSPCGMASIPTGRFSNTLSSRRNAGNISIKTKKWNQKGNQTKRKQTDNMLKESGLFKFSF